MGKNMMMKGMDMKKQPMMGKNMMMKGMDMKIEEEKMDDDMDEGMEEGMQVRYMPGVMTQAGSKRARIKQSVDIDDQDNRFYEALVRCGEKPDNNVIKEILTEHLPRWIAKMAKFLGLR